MNQMFTIGKIVNTHGVKGEIKVMPMTDDPTRFEKLKTVYLVNKTTASYPIETVRYHKGCVLLKLKGIEDMNAAERLKGSEIKIERKDSLPLGKDEYYRADLYDLEVYTEEKRFLGKLVDILETGSNDVYVLRKADRPKDLLIPAIKQVIKDVDIPNKTMTVHLLEGLEALCE